MIGDEPARGRDADRAVPWGHGEVVWLGNKRKREFGETSGWMNGKTDVVGKEVLEESSEGLVKISARNYQLSRIKIPFLE